MTGRPASDKVRAARKAAVEDALRRGFFPPGVSRGKDRGALSEAADNLKSPRQTIEAWWKIERREALAGRKNFLPDWTIYQEPEIVVENQGAAPIKVRVKAISTPARDAPVHRVLAIGDLHDSPSIPDKSRFRWIARHAAATRPDKIVQIGDWASFDSCSRHEAPGSMGQKLRPSINQDFESLEESLAIFMAEAGDGFSQDVTLGNHEERVLRVESATAELQGVLWPRLQETFARYRWRTHDPYKPLYVGGCMFVHVPMTLAGRPYTGKQPENSIINDTTVSIIYGHTHRANVVSRAKIGPVQKLTVLNLGSALPAGHVEAYATTALTGWSWGVFDLTLQAGQVTAHRFIPMNELEERYGD